MVFYCMKCRNCGMWAVKETKDISKASFTCKFCNKTKKIKKKNLYGLSMKHFGPFNTGKEAGKRSAEANIELRNIKIRRYTKESK